MNKYKGFGATYCLWLFCLYQLTPLLLMISMPGLLLADHLPNGLRSILLWRRRQLRHYSDSGVNYYSGYSGGPSYINSGANNYTNFWNDSTAPRYENAVGVYYDYSYDYSVVPQYETYTPYETYSPVSYYSYSSYDNSYDNFSDSYSNSNFADSYGDSNFTDSYTNSNFTDYYSDFSNYDNFSDSYSNFSDSYSYDNNYSYDTSNFTDSYNY